VLARSYQRVSLRLINISAPLRNATNAQGHVAVDFEIFAKERAAWKAAAMDVPQCLEGVDGGWVRDAGRFVKL
jgi:hypothetical protein